MLYRADQHLAMPFPHKYAFPENGSFLRESISLETHLLLQCFQLLSSKSIVPVKLGQSIDS